MDEELLMTAYWAGFTEELFSGKKSNFHAFSKYERVAFLNGRMDAIFGDSNPSIDEQTEEEILKRIRNEL